MASDELERLARRAAAGDVASAARLLKRLLDRAETPPAPRGGESTLDELLADVGRGVDRVEANVRSCLLAEGLPELYAGIVASEVAEGWMNGDPAPLWTSPGYAPPQNDPRNLETCSDTADAVRAWEAHWEAERGQRGNPRRGDWELVSVEPSRAEGKKYTATFRDRRTGRSRTSHFGATGYSDFTIHKDPERKRRYLERHGRGREDWDDPTTPGALSRWLLWNKPTFGASLRDFKRRFGL